MRVRTFSWATMIAPAFPRFSLPPVWSPCQWVFTTKRTGSGVSVRTAARIFSVSGAYWSSIRKTPSGLDGRADVAALAVQHVDVAGDPGRRDDDLRVARRRLVAEDGRRRTDRPASPATMRGRRVMNGSWRMTRDDSTRALRDRRLPRIVSPMNATLEQMIAHRSIRRFTPDAIPDSEIRRAVEAGQAASTSSAVQAYVVIQVTDPAERLVWFRSREGRTRSPTASGVLRDLRRRPPTSSSR